MTLIIERNTIYSKKPYDCCCPKLAAELRLSSTHDQYNWLFKHSKRNVWADISVRRQQLSTIKGSIYRSQLAQISQAKKFTCCGIGLSFVIPQQVQGSKYWVESKTDFRNVTNNNIETGGSLVGPTWEILLPYGQHIGRTLAYSSWLFYWVFTPD